MKVSMIPVTLLGLSWVGCKAVDSGKGTNNRFDLENIQVETETGSTVVKEDVESWTPMTPPEPIKAVGPSGKEGSLYLAAGVITDRLNAGQELTPGQSIVSPDGRFLATFQADSNFVLYLRGRPIWASNTQNRGGKRLTFQADGNLVMYTATNAPIWSSNTFNKGGVRTQISDTGLLAVYKADNTQLWGTNTGIYPPTKPTDVRPIAIGKWSGKIAWPIIPIHSLLMPDGKVFTFGTDANGNQGAQGTYDIWTPSLGTGPTSHATMQNVTNVDIFCAAPLLIPANGNVLIPGGDQRAPTANVGIKDTVILGKDSKQLTRGPFLTYGRWYETATTLPNGEIMVHGGIDGNRIAITAPEVYSPTTNTWRTLMGAANGEVINGGEGKWWYPRNWVGPNGRVFGMTGEKYYSINPAGAGSVQVYGNLPAVSRSYHSTAVMYAPGKIIQMGGTVNGNIGGQGSSGAIEVDINGANPTITTLNPMAFERTWGSSVVLPSGEVLVAGGSQYDNQLVGVAYTAEMWSPVTKKFRPLATNATPRLYHSSALLLPDASVLVGGGGAPGPAIQKDFEIYYPPYLYSANGAFAPRPVLGRSTAREDYNHLSNISFSGSGAPTKVVLVRTGAATHSFDMDQRFIPLTFATNAQTINVRMPANANLAPPGYYMLFALNAQGVPSLAKIITLGVPRAADVLQPGDVLSAGDSLRAPDGRTRLAFQADGNLVIYHQNQAIWASGTNGRGGVKVMMQADGNLVMYTNNETPIWASNTFGAQFAGGRLVLQNDANLVLYKGAQPYWASGTCCR